MALTRKIISKLTGGVSEQADSIRSDSQCSEQINFLSDPVKGIVKRPGIDRAQLPLNLQTPVRNDYTERFDHIFTRNGVRMMFSIHAGMQGSPGSLTLQKGSMALNNLDTGAAITLKDADGAAFTDATMPAYLKYTGTYQTNPYAAVTVADFTFIVNKEKVPAMESTLSQASNDWAKTDSFRSLIFVREGAYNAEYEVIATDSSGYKRRVLVKTSDGLGDGNVLDSKTDNIALAIKLALSAKQGDEWVDKTFKKGTSFNIDDFDGTHTDGTTFGDQGLDEDTGITISTTDIGGDYDPDTNTAPVIYGSTVSLRRETGTNTTEVEVSDSYGDSMISAIGDTIDSFSGLPVVGVHGFMTKVEGNPESTLDDYYIRFVADDGVAGQGRWEEDVVAGVKFGIDGATMPFTLVRIDDANYSFIEGAWEDKTVGDDTSDPQPNFIGAAIQDVFLFKSRLGFLSGESVTMSAANGPFTFFRDTVTQVLSTDPIEIESTVNDITNLHYAVPFANQMVVFSDRNQFIVTSGRQPLTPNTAALSLVASYQMNAQVRPVAVNNNILFAQSRSGASAILELYPTGTSEYSFDASDICEHVPNYLPGNVLRMTASSLAQTLLVTTDDSTTKRDIFCYKWYDKGRERVVSSWSKFTLGDDIVDNRMIHFDDTNCYVLSAFSSTVGGAVVSYAFGTFKTDNTLAGDVSLDFKKTRAEFDGLSYDAGEDVTTISETSDYSLGQIANKQHLRIYDTDTGELGVFESAGTPINGHLITGNWATKADGSARNWELGLAVAAEYEFSDQYLKEPEALGKSLTAAVDGRTTVKWAEVYLSNSEYMTFETSYLDQYKSTTTKIFSGNVVGSVTIGTLSSETGTLRTIVGSKNNMCTMKLKSDTPQSAIIHGASFELGYTSRLRNRN